MKKYNVYDTEDECNIMENVEASDIQERFNCTMKKVYDYSYKGKRFENRYTVHPAEEKGEPKAFMTPAQEDKFTREWNNVMIAAKLLKTGHGKLVVRNGKKCVVMI